MQYLEKSVDYDRPKMCYANAFHSSVKDSLVDNDKNKKDVNCKRTLNFN